ncbi:MAG: ABC transporter substrate-binding protein [Pseudomonadota bacterium]|nr:ABC transporter substrate-binding protein [Pseudomonadota bacterium]
MRIVSWLLLCGLATCPAWAAAPIPITLATAGPGNLSHLPVDLIKKIGADRAEGVELAVRYFGGGPLAYKDMLEKNADFAVAGAPALAGLKLQGEPVVSIATVNRVPTFVLMLRASLKGKVKKTADLKGRVIGVNTSSASTKSTSQQVAEFALRQAGVSLAQVNFVPAGQSLEDQMAALDSGAVDALMGDEPFASRLKDSGKVTHLLDLHDLGACRKAMGGLFLNAQLATRAEVIKNNPDKVERMVRVLRRTLQWIASHSAEEVVARLDLADPDARASLLRTLQRHKAIYSPDGAYTEEQIRTTERFFRENNAGDEKARAFSFDTLIDSRWAGRVKP